MQTSRPALIVSIHDVSPLTAARTDVILRDLADLGLDRTSLLIIPNHHHKAPIEEDEAFGRWARDKVAQGHEAVLHGYYHLRPPKKTGWWSSLITERYTAGEGEFFDLLETEAAEKLRKGRADLSRIGLDTRGFIAPAWLLGQEAEEAVRKAGFGYTTRLGSFKDLQSGALTASQSLVWSVRAGWRRVISLGWNAWLYRSLRQTPLVRVGIHPPDWDHAAIRAQVLRLVRAALAGREGMTYDEWLTRVRSRP